MRQLAIMKTFSRDGMRAWILAAAFIGLYFASTIAERPLARLLAEASAPIWSASRDGEVSPRLLITLCISRTILVVAVTAIIGRLQGRNWVNYGLSPWKTSGLLMGLIAGVAAVTMLMLCLWISGNLAITAVDLSPSALSYGFIWALGMLLVGVSEEMEFRGMPVLLLSRSGQPVGAVLLSVALFTYVHTGNSGENVLGLGQIAAFAAVAAISVVRTGSIAWAIGFHAAWDWTLEYFFGAVGSGYTFQGHLLSQTLQGSTWLTGGAAGPEGSAFALMVLLVVAGFVCRGWPSPPSQSRTAK